jgi:hypothetical protein
MSPSLPLILDSPLQQTPKRVRLAGVEGVPTVAVDYPGRSSTEASL